MPSPEMPLPKHWQIRCPDEAATQALATRLAQQPDLADATLSLQGELGAGKTTFVRHLLRALGITGRIKSPTYAVVEPHDVPPSATRPGGLKVWHFDFYRFNDPRELEDAGLRELFADPGLKLVEWPQKAQNLMPRTDLTLELRMTGENDQREIHVTAHTPTGHRLLEGLRP